MVVWLEDVEGDWVRWKYNPLRDLEDEGFSGQKILVLFFQETVQAAQFEPSGMEFQGRMKRGHQLVATFAEDEESAISNAVDCTFQDADYELIEGHT